MKERDKNRGCGGSIEWAIVAPGGFWRDIFLWKTGDRHKERKKEQKRKKTEACGN